LIKHVEGSLDEILPEGVHFSNDDSKEFIE
jgi:hypothetical protein